MPSLHCHFPPDEEEPVPQQEIQEIQGPPEGRETGDEADTESEEAQMDEDEETAESEASVENEESDEDERIEIDDSSSEASSMLDDPTIQPWVPVVSSSDENESGEEKFWTPPSTIAADEFEQIDVGTSSGLGARQPARNMARRSRGRNHGQIYARRGRHRQPVSEQDTYVLTPFERGVTFNGFARNLEPEKITGYKMDLSGDMLYSVKWKTQQGSRAIESSVMRTHRPQMLIDYYESIVESKFFLQYTGMNFPPDYQQD